MVKDVHRYLAQEAPVEKHLSDQVLLSMALAGEGEYVTITPSRHTLTNIDVIRHFLNIGVEIGELGEKLFKITLKA